MVSEVAAKHLKNVLLSVYCYKQKENSKFATNRNRIGISKEQKNYMQAVPYSSLLLFIGLHAYVVENALGETLHSPQSC